MKSIQQLSVAGIAVIPLLFTPAAQCDFINEDFTVVAPNATDFEVLLRGNKVNQIGTKFISPFNNGAQVNFNNVNNTTVIKFNAFDGQNFGMGVNHFGFVLANAPFVEGGVGFGIPGVIAKLVSFTPPPAPPKPRLPPLPAIDAALGIVANGEMPVSLENLSSDTVSLFQTGLLVTSTAFALEDLNRTTLPPSAFQSAGIPDGTRLAPGQSASFSVPVMPGEFVTIFTDTQFSGASTANDYKGFVGDWVESQATTPEPGAALMILVGLMLFACTRRVSPIARRC